MTSIKSVCVFCGASNAVDKTFLDLGAAFGEGLARRDMRLVYGGGDCGVMGAVANSTMTNGGKVTGIFPVSLRNIENEHQSLTEILIVNSMHERKMGMFERSDAFVVLPGGFGTMDEMFEIITWHQLRLHDRPVIILNHEGYWNPLIALMKNIVEMRFAKTEVATFYHVVNTVEEAFDLLDR